MGQEQIQISDTMTANPAIPQCWAKSNGQAHKGFLWGVWGLEMSFNTGVTSAVCTGHGNAHKAPPGPH